jgi:hypothetical protein
VIEAGTWDNLSTSHRDITAPYKIPSSYPNVYGKVPYPFPAAPQLSRLGAVSDAVVRRILHKNPAFLSEMKTLLCSDPIESRG